MTTYITDEQECSKAPEGWTHRRDGDACLYCGESFAPHRVEGFICMTREGSWGWGADAATAVRQARKAGGGRGARKGERLVYQLPSGALDAWVDQMGSIQWTWAAWVADDDRHVIGVNVEVPKD